MFTLVSSFIKRVILTLATELFAAEVSDILLNRLHMLDDCTISPWKMPDVAKPYLEKRLLSNQKSLSPSLDRIRYLARYLSAADGAAGLMDCYPNYIKSLTTLLVQHRPDGVRSMSNLFQEETEDGRRLYDERAPVEEDLITAAAYTNHLSIVKERSEGMATIWCIKGTLGNPYRAATLNGNVEILDFLFEKMSAETRGSVTTDFWFHHVCLASSEANIDVVHHLLDYGWAPQLKNYSGCFIPKFYRAMFTPNLDVFNFFMHLKKQMEEPFKPLDTLTLERHIRGAAENGWYEMVVHLLELGAPAHIDDRMGTRNPASPLFWACTSADEKVVRLLLRHGAKVSARDVNTAARRGDMDILKALFEHGADVDDELKSHLQPAVSHALLLEHPKMFHYLMERGAEIGEGTVDELTEEGLESMLTLLEEHGVDTDPITTA